jgi:hypothetical protein
MSVWTDVEGSAWNIPRTSGFGFKTAIEEGFQEARPTVLQIQAGREALSVDFKFSFSEGGLEAAKQLDKFVATVKEKIPGAYVDITANIRYTS